MEARDKLRSNLKNKLKTNLNAILKRRNEHQADVKQEQQQQTLIPQWRRWCRLCAKEDEKNFNVFLGNEQIVPDKMLPTAIGKYFWINIKTDDEISQFICNECHMLMNALLSFTERVNKVQTMFYLLINSNSSDPIDPNELRLQYGLLDEERQHIMRYNDIEIFDEDEVKDTKPTLKLEAGEKKKEIKAIVDDDDDYDYNAEYKQALKETETSENAIAEIEFISENESPKPSKIVGSFKKTFKKENSLSHDERISKSTEDAENDENDDVIYEYTVEDDDDDDEDVVVNFVEDHIDKLDRDEKIKEPDSVQLRNPRKRGRPPKYRAEEKNNSSGLEKRNKIKIESNNEEDDESIKFSCNLCPKKYKSIVVYRRHMFEVHNVLDKTTVEYHCSQCDKVFELERQLTAHVQTHLPMELKQTFPCPYCDKKFTKEIIVEQHIKCVHRNEKPFVCEECGRALKTNAALKEHKFTHTNYCPCECEVCHKRFKNKARLKIHMDIHNSTCYECEVCGLQLNTRRTLNMHMLCHSNDKPFKCDHCGNKFKRAKALKNHLIIHTGLKPYVCEFCNKAFANGSNCRSHKKKTHPVELAAAEAQGITPLPRNVPKLDHLREVTKHSKNLRPVTKQIGLPPNWREVLLKAEARAKLIPQENEQNEDDMQPEDEDLVHEENIQHLDDTHEDESAAIIIEKIVSDGRDVEEIEIQLSAIDS